MLKSFTPVIVMLGLYISGIEPPNWWVILSILAISLGTAITCTFTPQISILGLFVMFLSSSSEATKMVLTQYVVKNLHMGVVESQYFLSSSTASCLFLASVIMEFRTMYENKGFQILLNHPNIFLLAGLLGVFVNFLTYFVIQLTSSLNLKILNTLRNILLIFVSIFFYKEYVSVNEVFGYSVALMGFIG